MVPALPTPMVTVSTIWPSRAMDLHNGRAGNAAVELRVIIVGKPVHIVPAVFRRRSACQRPGGVQPAARAGLWRICAPSRSRVSCRRAGASSGMVSTTGWPAVCPASVSASGKRAGGRFNDGLAGLEGPRARARASIPSARFVPCRTGGAVVKSDRHTAAPAARRRPDSPAVPQWGRAAGSGRILVDGHDDSSFPVNSRARWFHKSCYAFCSEWPV